MIDMYLSSSAISHFRLPPSGGLPTSLDLDMYARRASTTPFPLDCNLL